MGPEEEHLSSDEKVKRSVGRTISNVLVVSIAVAALAGWGYFGFYQLDPGQAAVVLRLGAHQETVVEPGLKWHLPPPFESHVVVKTGEISREEFGVRDPTEASPTGQALLEAAMQTRENNIVHLGFVVQYRLKDAFAARYRIAHRTQVLRDAAQAAVRSVVGRMTIEGVLSEQRGDVELDAREELQVILDHYGAGLAVIAVQLQNVQPPAQVRAAFDDVIAAAQDASRAINEAEGHRNEVLPRARAEAVELREAAGAYRESKVVQSEGDAMRFTALAEEFRKAPTVTQKRLYLETMEAILPEVEKVIIEPGTASVLPYLPLGQARDGGLR